MTDYEVLDRTLNWRGQTVTSTTVYHVRNYRVRSTVELDASYENQAYAKVEVLASNLTWTYLTNSPTRVWWEAAKMAHFQKNLTDEQDILEDVSDELAGRADRILP